MERARGERLGRKRFRLRLGLRRKRLGLPLRQQHHRRHTLGRDRPGRRRLGLRCAPRPALPLRGLVGLRPGSDDPRPPRDPRCAEQSEECPQLAAGLVGRVAGVADWDVGYVDQPVHDQQRSHRRAPGCRRHQRRRRAPHQRHHQDRHREHRDHGEHDVDRPERLPSVQRIAPDADHLARARHPDPAVQPEPRQEHRDQQQSAAGAGQELAGAGASRGHRAETLTADAILPSRS